MKGMKRLVTLLLTAAMVLAMITVGCAAVERPRFEDVPEDSWFAEAVEYCREKGLMNGTSADRFEPDATMTRAMLATVLYRQAGSPAVTGPDRFTDTAEGAWYTDAILWAAREKIINGYGGGLFGPNDPVTREQVVTIFWRVAGSPAEEDSELFADQSDIAGYAVTAVAWARRNGVVNGRDGNRFAPKENATRAEVAAILANQAKAAQEEPAPSPAPSGGTVISLPKPKPTPEPEPTPSPEPEPEPSPEPEPAAHILVAYFSATNNTESIANHIKAVFGGEADLYEILPEIPYTAEDLDYNSDCRANREQNDPAARPAITGAAANMAQYDVVFLGYPIWWGQAPKILYTFVEAYDLSGKTVVPFCTSGSSPIGSSAANLEAATTGATWLSGSRFDRSASQSAVESWVNGLELPEATPDHNEEGSDQMYLQVSGAQSALWTAALADNSSAEALKELLKSGPLVIQMSDYSNFEKVGPLGQSLPTNDEQITTQAGDIILYQGRNLVIYYDTNSWSFTRLGKVNGVTQAEMKAILGTGDVTVTLSLTAPD